VHELGIAQSIVEIAAKNAREQGAERVLVVTVEVGAFAGVLPEALEFCFEACCQDTLLEGSCLRIERVPARGRCQACHQEFPVDSYFTRCPACSAAATELLSGEELRIRDMEVD